MRSSFDYDLLIIGSGPGGYVSGIRASQLGLKTAVFEKEKVGGVCLNIGCIPSKSLIHQAGLFGALNKVKKWGIKIDKTGFDYSKVFDNSRRVAQILSRGVDHLLKKNSVDLIQGEAKISDTNTITLPDGKKVSGKNIIIATGSRPLELSAFPFDQELVLSSDNALMMQKLPKSMIILGAGAIGVEFSYILSSFDVEVHLVEAMEDILPIEDKEVVGVLKNSFKKMGIKIHTSSKAVQMTRGKGGISIEIVNTNGEKKKIESEKLLVAVGRTPNTENLGIEGIGLKTEKGFIPVNDYYQTHAKGVFAIGDVINTPLLAHVASKEGEIAVEYIAGKRPQPRLDQSLVPSAIYSEPQIASFGLSESQAKSKGINFKKTTFPYRGAGKSLAIDKGEGIVKLLYNPDTREILGAHIVGAEATELIHEILLAKKSELLPQDIAQMIHAHPTLSEAIMESTRAIEGWAIHI